MRKSMAFDGAAVTLLLLLAFLMAAMLLSPGSDERQAGSFEDVRYILPSEDGILYVFMDGHIQAIDSTGKELWDYMIPDGWKVCYGWSYQPDVMWSVVRGDPYSPPVFNITAVAGGPIAFGDDGMLYIYLKPSGSSNSTGLIKGELIALSSDGRLRWSLPLDSLQARFSESAYRDPERGPDFSDAVVYASGGRVYVFHHYNETIIDNEGRVLWSIANVSDPAAIDEEGYVFCVPSREPTPSYPQPFAPYADVSGPYIDMDDYRVPSAIIQAYYPNGTLYWTVYAGELLYRQYCGRCAMPLYHNGTLYAPSASGVVAMGRDGTIRWAFCLDKDGLQFKYITIFNRTRESEGDLRLYGPMPFDSKGNVYLEYASRDLIPYDNFTRQANGLYLITLGPDGREISRTFFFSDRYVCAGDGIGYATNGSLYGRPRYGTAPALTSLASETLMAFNISDGSPLWHYTFPVDGPTLATINECNVPEANSISAYGGIASDVSVPYIIDKDGMAYAYFRSINYETPAVPNKTGCAYVSGIYAFDRNGTLRWSRRIGPDVSHLSVAGNGTIFYMSDGRLTIIGMGAMAGLAFSALAYLFIRFFCLGEVARAKARMSRNENRDRILGFVSRNPGSSLHEVARGTGINLGTVRYHLFILGMGHKVVARRTDGKYVRYFINSGSYSEEAQLILSLMRRKATGRVLRLIMERPGVTNVEAARELGIRESVACRCMRELLERGLIDKGPDGRYIVKEEKREHVDAAMRRI